MSKKKKTLKLYTTAFLTQKDIFYNSFWLRKFVSKFMINGKKHLSEKHINLGFVRLKYLLKKLPGYFFIEQLLKFKPVLTFTTKRMGRKFNPIPIPIKEKRQLVLSINYIVKYIKNIVSRDLSTKIVIGFSDLFTTKKNAITRKIADDVRYLSEARIYMHLRWK